MRLLFVCGRPLNSPIRNGVFNFISYNLSSPQLRFLFDNDIHNLNYNCNYKYADMTCHMPCMADLLRAASPRYSGEAKLSVANYFLYLEKLKVMKPETFALQWGSSRRVIQNMARRVVTLYVLYNDYNTNS